MKINCLKQKNLSGIICMLMQCVCIFLISVMPVMNIPANEEVDIKVKFYFDARSYHAGDRVKMRFCIENYDDGFDGEITTMIVDVQYDSVSLRTDTSLMQKLADDHGGMGISFIKNIKDVIDYQYVNVETPLQKGDKDIFCVEFDVLRDVEDIEKLIRPLKIELRNGRTSETIVYRTDYSFSIKEQDSDTDIHESLENDSSGVKVENQSTETDFGNKSAISNDGNNNSENNIKKNSSVNIVDKNSSVNTVEKDSSVNTVEKDSSVNTVGKERSESAGDPEKGRFSAEEYSSIGSAKSSEEKTVGNTKNANPDDSLNDGSNQAYDHIRNNVSDSDSKKNNKKTLYLIFGVLISVFIIVTTILIKHQKKKSGGDEKYRIRNGVTRKK